MRSFRNVLLVTAIILAIGASGVVLLGVLAPGRIRLRVYERGAGETLACGSGACAAVAVGIRQGRLARHVAVELPGGTLEITWYDDETPLTMAGPTAFVFDGVLG